MRFSPVRAARRGFTLVELLVTLAMLGVVGTILSRIMLDQQRFYQKTNEQMGVRRELRTAMSTVPGDLRSISSVGGDVLSFGTTQITFRSTFGVSVVCNKPNPSTIDIPPLNMARTTLTAWASQPTVGDTIYAFRSDSMGAGGDSWTAHRISAVSSDATLCPGSAFVDAALDAGKLRWRFTVTPVIADSVKVGAAIRFTRPTKYELTQGSSDKWYLARSELTGGAWTAVTPMAGPFLEPSSSGSGGLRFAMYDSLGAVVASGGNAMSISRIDLTFRAQGASSSGAVGGSSSTKDSLAFRIALRNRQ